MNDLASFSSLAEVAASAADKFGNGCQTFFLLGALEFSLP
jgi:hypothetical protein